MMHAAVVSPFRIAKNNAVPEAETAGQIRLMPPYKLLLLNDDFHSMDFVVNVLTKVMRWDVPKALDVMLDAHNHGKAIVMIGPLEVVELKHEQMLSLREGDKGPLHCVIEPA